MLNYELCCLFKKGITFKTTTIANLKKYTRSEQLKLLGDICWHNALALQRALRYCSQNGIGSFRVSSRLLPCYTHFEYGYTLDDLPNGEKIVDRLKRIGTYAKENNIRVTFHPDQFVILNSKDQDLTQKSIQELEYHNLLANYINADVINIHGGGGYGNKKLSLERLSATLATLSNDLLKKLTLENDDKVFTPEDLFPICEKHNIPMCYDVHHHRCLPDGMTIKEATNRAILTWNREPLFHISSPKNGWVDKNPRYHADYIDIKDFPEEWKNLNITISVEAKMKEDAVKRLMLEVKDLPY